MTIHYFIPDWDDRVDPGYNFINDLHTQGRHPYRDDMYAHEIYDHPPYDGILLSRAVLDDNKTKSTTIKEMGSVHSYLRLPPTGVHRVMGDCGAFSYWEHDEPPYQTDDILNYYQDLGFDVGVSVDHLIFSEFDHKQKERRWQITIDNAQEFLTLHQQRGYTFDPMGVAQGWDAESYRQAVQELVSMGYKQIAVGGLVRSTDKEIIRILEAINPVLTHDVKELHLFGVSRPEYIPTFMKLGVTSFDSASRLRKAWTDNRKNYYLDDQAFTAIRIRDAKRLAKENSLDETKTSNLEQAALKALRDYDNGAESFDSAYDAILAYAELSGTLTERMKKDYQRTLQEQPWKKCPCAICKNIGVEVIIFRGNNRNRRRGFHNTWQLYQELQHMREQTRNGVIDSNEITQLSMELGSDSVHQR